MNIVTDEGIVDIVDGPDFTRISYTDGSTTLIATRFFQMWNGTAPEAGTFYVGKNSVIGTGSTVRYDFSDQSLRIGRYFSGGMGLRFILNATHNMNLISTWGGLPQYGLPGSPGELFDDTRVGNDVWIGDEAMILGGVSIGDGCVIGARSLVLPKTRLEPYGIYAGHPARLLRFRFSPKIIEQLLSIRWWEMPLTWIRENAANFKIDLNADEPQALEFLSEMQERAARARLSEEAS
jgi:virginiamycin A acetyltransferase